jgi:putative ABC transport system permease protein
MFKNNLKIAWRSLNKNKGYSFLNISGMAIGLATFWLIALYVADEFSYDETFSNSNRIYRVVQHASWDNGNMDIALTSPPYATTFKNTFPEVEDAVRIGTEGGDLMSYDDKTIRQDDLCYAEQSFFKLFDYHFLFGDANTALEKPESIVITESLAIKLFGDASKAQNKTILFGSGKFPNKVTAVIKDMPKNSHIQFSGIRSFGVDELKSEGWDDVFLYTYLLLKEGSDIQSLQKKLVLLEKDLAEQMEFKDFQLELQPLSAIHLNSNLDYEMGNNGSISRVNMFIMIGILVLLIALINYMNLATARSIMRVREIGVRKVLGSEKKHLVGLFISEALLVTFLAALVACFLVQMALPLFNQITEKDMGLWRFGVVNTIGAIMLFTLLAGILSGSYPSLFLSRFKMIPSLKGQLGSMQASNILRKSLVVFQFVVTVCLVSGSYIIYRQMQFVFHKDLGFNKEQVVIAHIDNMKVRNDIPALKQELLKSSLIEGVATAGNPIGTNYLGKYGFYFEKNGKLQSVTNLANFLYADEDFFQTNGMDLLQGRNFSKNMSTDKDHAIIINETLMNTLGYTNAIGKKAKFNLENDSVSNRVIVGVVKDFHASSLQHKIEPMVLLLPPENRERDNLYVKLAKGKAVVGLAFLKNTYAKFNFENNTDFHFLNENFNKQYVAEQKQEKLGLVFTILAFIISCLGLFGIVMFITAQRKKEIGVRKVLGATIISVAITLSKEFGKLIAFAAIIAFPIAWFVMDRWLQNFAYRIDTEWWMFALGGLITLLITSFTFGIQAFKSASANPVKSLRTE